VYLNQLLVVYTALTTCAMGKCPIGFLVVWRIAACCDDALPLRIRCERCFKLLIALFVRLVWFADV